MPEQDPRTRILRALDDGPRSHPELMRAAGVSRRRLFTLVEELAEAGHLRKVPDLRDMRRRIYVGPRTADGPGLGTRTGAREDPQAITPTGPRGRR